MYTKSRSSNKYIFAFSLAIIFAASVTYAQVVGGPDDAGPGTNNPGGAGNASTTAPTGDLLRDGIFGCSASKYQNAGTTVAIGGVYVPVNDAAVTLNTGYLVYKECVLDGVVSSIKNNAVGELQRRVILAANTGRGGRAQYLQNWRLDLGQREDTVVVQDLSDTNIGPMCGAFRNNVRTAFARQYYLTSRNPTASYSCTLPDNAPQGPFNWTDFNESILPENNPLGAYYQFSNKVQADLAINDTNIRQMLDWGRGMFPTFDENGDPASQSVVTPAYVIADSLSQMIGAGTDILINANEIGEINGALQAGLTTQLISDTRGLTGISQSIGGQPSFLNQMVRESSNGVQQNALNAALQIVSTALQVESAYHQAKAATANAITNTILQLRAMETSCWNLIIFNQLQSPAGHVCAAQPTTNQCTSYVPPPAVPTNPPAPPVAGVQLTIATSTAHSQQIIDSQLAAAATTTVQDLRKSEQAITLLNELVAGLTNSSSATNQRAALIRLDTMVANNQLHTGNDVVNANTQRDTVIAALAALVTDTRNAWGDSTDPNIGWCNINNPIVITNWINAWSH